MITVESGHVHEVVRVVRLRSASILVDSAFTFRCMTDAVAAAGAMTGPLYCRGGGSWAAGRGPRIRASAWLTRAKLFNV